MSFGFHYAFLYILFVFIIGANALHASEAGVVDWHKSFIGVPLIESLSTSPTFHRIFSSDASTRSLVYTATSANVLAAVDPLTSEIVWRYIYVEDDPIIQFRAQGDTVLSLSGPGGATLRVFDASTGQLKFERRLHKVEDGRLFDPSHLGCDILFQNRENSTLPASNVFVLDNGYELSLFDSQVGEVKWRHAESSIEMVIFSKLTMTTDAVYMVGLSKAGTSYKIQVTSLSMSTGEVLASARIPSAVKNGLTDFLVLSDDSQSARIVWLQDNTIFSITLSPSLNTQASTIKGASYSSIKDVGLSQKGLFVAQKVDGSAQVISVSEADIGLHARWDFADSVPSDDHTESLYVGGLDKNDRAYIARIFWSHSHARASAHIFAPHLSEGRGLVSGFTFPFETNFHGIVKHVALDVANPSDMTVVARLVLTTSTGAVQLWHHDKIQWTREESLTEIMVAEYVDIPEKQTITAHNDIARESLGARLRRQILEARYFPSYLYTFLKRFATGSYASVTTSAVVGMNTSEQITRDVFGFRKVIVAATSKGTVFGVNSGNGAILWSRLLDLGWTREVGGHHQPVKIFLTRTASDGATPQIVLVTQRYSDNGLVDTVIFHIEALNGEDVLGKSSSNRLLEGIDIVPSEMLDTFLLPDEGRTVAVIDTQLQVHLYPDTGKARESFSRMAASLHFPLLENGRITGHRVTDKPEITGNFMAYPIWASLVPIDESILSLSRHESETVASLGKVLGDRRTLYKYLNPHLITVTTKTTQPNLPITCGVYVLDGAKGTVVYHAVVPSLKGSCDLFVTLKENWLLYFYYDDENSVFGDAKGYRIVTVEFYEGKQINDKTRSSEASIYSNSSNILSFYEQTYIYPTAITAAAITSTRFGITSKDLIVANPRNQVQSFTRRLFDPRRPKRKVTSQEAEEWLIQYDPVIPDDPRRIISHNYQVAKIRQILTSPALLESTSLVFAYGLDLFSSRVAPSNTFDVLSESFNKLQLVLTVTALAVAILVTRPMVAKKRLRESWYTT